MPDTMKPRVSLTSPVDSSRMEKNPKLLMFKSSHDVILKKSKTKRYPQNIPKLAWYPSYSEGRSWRVCEAKAICGLYRKPWLKTQPTNHSKCCQASWYKSVILTTWEVMVGGSQVQGLPGLWNKFKAKSLGNLLRPQPEMKSKEHWGYSSAV